jgi:hypothetical protein
VLALGFSELARSADFGKVDHPHARRGGHRKRGQQNRQQPDDPSRSHRNPVYRQKGLSDLLRLARMSRPDTSPGWQTMRNPADVADLMSLCGHFHDACIREIHVATGHYVNENLSMTVDWKTTIHVLVQRQSRLLPAIELRFEEVVGMRFAAPEPNYESIILDAAFFLRDGIFYWADSGFWTPESAKENTWVAARKVSWRDASDWLGGDLRYQIRD